jgi:hypothetical protein
VRNVYKVLVGKPEWEQCMVGLGIDGRVILKWILSKQDCSIWTGFILFGIGTIGRSM